MMENDILSEDEQARYARHFNIPEFGREGQRKIKNASVLIVGCGGLGSASAVYLAAAGIGKMCIVDSDDVELSNLQRQIIHSTESIGRPKVVSAESRLSSLNPNVELIPLYDRVDDHNILEIISDYEIVVDATDNFETRYILNEACVKKHIPFIYGAIYQFSGQVSVFNFQDGPCFQCVFKNPPTEEYKIANRGIGVVGALPGVIGSIQALEAIKIVTGIGNPLSGRLLIFDGIAMQFREISINKISTCAICSKNK